MNESHLSHGAGGLSGLRVCSFESRMGSEMQALIERQGGIVTVAPSRSVIRTPSAPEAHSNWPTFAVSIGPPVTARAAIAASSTRPTIQLRRSWAI